MLPLGFFRGERINRRQTVGQNEAREQGAACVGAGAGAFPGKQDRAGDVVESGRGLAGQSFRLLDAATCSARCDGAVERIAEGVAEGRWQAVAFCQPAAQHRLQRVVCAGLADRAVDNIQRVDVAGAFP